MIGRIDQRFALTKKEGRAALIPYIMAGDPDRETTQALLQTLAANGADIIELGMPFSDPMADGVVIQAAGQRALKAGTKIKHVLECVADFRQHDEDTPIILMGYYNNIYHYGAEAFCAEAAKAGVDGLILVDLPPEEETEFRPLAEASDIALIRLIAPTSVPERLPLLLKDAKGFAYYISVTGITGANAADPARLSNELGEVKAHSSVPVAVGFGIKTTEQAAAVASQADAVVVGSALVSTIAEAKSGKEAVGKAAEFIQSMAKALRK